jgi:hypothetical protein
MPLWSPFAGGWQCSTFVSYEAPAATEEHPLVQMVCGCGAFQPGRYLRHTHRCTTSSCKGLRRSAASAVAILPRFQHRRGGDGGWLPRSKAAFQQDSPDELPKSERLRRLKPCTGRGTLEPPIKLNQRFQPLLYRVNFPTGPADTKQNQTERIPTGKSWTLQPTAIAGSRSRLDLPFANERLASRECSPKSAGSRL